MDIQKYIESGILEAYVLDAVSESEASELLILKKQYPEVQNALNELERDMEFIAGQMAITPPAGTWSKIEDNINELITTEPQPLRLKERIETNGRDFKAPNKENFLEVEYESFHIRVHKSWKWIFAAVFVLGKIFLACAIYFYLENRQAQEQIQELKTEIRLQKTLH